MPAAWFSESSDTEGGRFAYGKSGLGFLGVLEGGGEWGLSGCSVCMLNLGGFAFSDMFLVGQRIKYFSSNSS